MDPTPAFRIPSLTARNSPISALSVPVTACGRPPRAVRLSHSVRRGVSSSRELAGQVFLVQPLSVRYAKASPRVPHAARLCRGERRTREVQLRTSGHKHGRCHHANYNLAPFLISPSAHIHPLLDLCSPVCTIMHFNHSTVPLQVRASKLKPFPPT